MSAQRARPKDESETLLEYCLDTLAPLPNSLKRHLEHISSLSAPCAAASKRARQLEKDTLAQVSAAVLDHPFPAGSAVPSPLALARAALPAPGFAGIEEARGARREHRALCQERLEAALQGLGGLGDHRQGRAPGGSEGWVGRARDQAERGTRASFSVERYTN
jgi:hypothetical protein